MIFSSALFTCTYNLISLKLSEVKVVETKPFESAVSLIESISWYLSEGSAIFMKTRWFGYVLIFICNVDAETIGKISNKDSKKINFFVIFAEFIAIAPL